MDPDEALTEMRIAIAKLRAQLGGGPDEEELAQAVLDTWEALDGWMSRGGYRPEDWKP